MRGLHFRGREEALGLIQDRGGKACSLVTGQACQPQDPILSSHRCREIRPRQAVGDPQIGEQFSEFLDRRTRGRGWR